MAKQLALVNVDNPDASPEPQLQSPISPRSASPSAMRLTPLAGVDVRQEANIWSSPASFKRLRLSGEALASSPLDTFLDEDDIIEDHTRKRTKLSRLS